MNKPKDEAHVYLAVFEFGTDSSVVTSLLGFLPTAVWSAGDPLPNHPTARRTHSRWSLHSPLPLHAHPVEHFEALLPVLEPHASRIRECAVRFPTQLSCAVYYRDFSPSIRLSSSILQRIAALTIPLDFDLYFLGANREESGHA
jgi:hypothetical protein